MSSIDKEKLETLKRELEKFKKGEKIKKRSRTTPLGKLFDKIYDIINGYQSHSDVITYLYKNLGGDLNQVDRLIKRKYVIYQILDYLSEINNLSVKKANTDIISIPLYDIRIIGDLTNIIIIQGIYSIIPNDYLIPIEKRNLKNFKNAITFSKIDLHSGIPILEKILVTFTEIFESNSDLKDLILVGTGFTDTLSISIFFNILSNTNSSYKNLVKYNDYIDRLEIQSSTYQLISFYSILLKNCKKDKATLAFISSLLSKQLLKKNGVESLIDLVLGLRENEEVDISKINYIVQILLTSKPQNINIINYYKNIFKQIYDMLILVNRPLMNTILVEIIIIVYGKNKKIIEDFLFKKIWDNLNPQLNKVENDSIILTNEIDLNNSFNVCISISRSINIKDHDFIVDLFNPIFITLWYYANYQRSKGKDFEIVLNLIKNIIILGDSHFFIDLVISNLIDYKLFWIFDSSNENDNNLTFIKFNTNEVTKGKENQILELIDKIDFNVETLIKLITKLNDSDSSYLNQVLIEALNKLVLNSDLENSSINKIIYLKIIQSIIENFKNEIESSPLSLLIFANTYFNQYFESLNSTSKLNIIEDVDSDDETEDNIDNLDDLDNNSSNDILISLIPILDTISVLSPTNDDEKIQLENLKSLLKSNFNLIPKSIKDVCSKIIKIDTENIKIIDKDTDFNIETILKQINDQTPSVRVLALDKLTYYTINNKDKNKIVSTKYSVNLLLSQLKDQEPFVYLNAIKNIVNIVSFDKSFLTQLIEIYSTSKKSIDEKLRVGEILTKFVSLNGKLLNDHQISELVNSTINISRADSSSIKDSSLDNNDVRMKISALSLLGITCHECGYGIISYIPLIADLVHGIITFEKTPELRRAAIVIINDVISNDSGLEIVKEYGEKLQILLEYVTENDPDLLVCQMSSATLDQISESFEKKLTLKS